MDPKTILSEYKKLVFKEVQSYLSKPPFFGSFAPNSKFDKDTELHWKMVSDYPTRQGKYLRPTLLVITAEAFGYSRSKVIKTAAAMQLSEEWILVHDDVEDNSVMRRGLPALHRIYGIELAVNAGDALQTIMWKVISDNREVLPPDVCNHITDEFYSILTRTIIGQSTELLWIKNKKLDFSDEDWYYIADGKTSYYTIAGPMRLGAIIGGASDSQLETISKFGTLVGRSFQITDDVLDFTSDFAGLKKQTYNDLYEGKRTLILGHLYRHASNTEKARISKIMAKPRNNKSDEEIAWLVDKIHKYESVNYAIETADKLKEQAIVMFNKEMQFIADPKARAKLLSLIRFIVERKY